ncbi:prepilin peptidase [Patescibacteria group bacterium]|nr:prepilin peptidase [Patescibacteria group bacterium]MBU1663612.1 prepilin peptidase [Patescibacteria group bacterium]MBU1934249.1 prepilin peptidase [Patescibacteria group bacterium]MBU2008090.1 prepilin peptidase [Patescibacteria group bacterium]MBU2233858.1 prepilin peptidase [Patescibacteria group bacterium]
MPIYLILIFIFLFGLIFGSFLNCLIWRGHKKIPLIPFVKAGNKWNRSYCPKCKKQIAWYDNIPVLSFIMLGGKCRQCKQSISWQYPVVELATGLLFAAAFLNNFEFSQLCLAWQAQGILNFESIFNDLIFNNSIKIHNSKLIIQLLRDFFLISVMIVIFIYDLRWYLILDIVTLPACLVMLIFNLSLGFSWWNLLISGIIGGGFFLIQLIISKGKWIGGGDIRLGLLIGLSLGWPGGLVAIIISYFIGSIAGTGLILAGKKQWDSEVPLGIFLTVGAIITLFWQEQILNWYLNIF